MSPRRYKADRRRAAMEETRRRIVEATVALHAEKGSTATTYAMIAKRADVAVPTVYNHFPNPAALFAACTGHVRAQAPALGPQIFEGASDVGTRVAALVRVVFASHRFMAPWMRRGVHEAALVPELGKAVSEARKRLAQLIAMALAPRFGAAPPVRLVAIFEILIDFTAWQRLTDDGALPDGDAESAAIGALMAIIGTCDLPGRHDRAADTVPVKPRRRPS